MIYSLDYVVVLFRILWMVPIYALNAVSIISVSNICISKY